MLIRKWWRMRLKRFVDSELYRGFGKLVLVKCIGNSEKI